jgi:hypothetical protein
VRNRWSTGVTLGFLFILVGLSKASRAAEGLNEQKLTQVKLNSRAPHEVPRATPRGGPGKTVMPAAVKPVESVGGAAGSGAPSSRSSSVSLVDRKPVENMPPKRPLKKVVLEISAQKPIHGSNFEHEAGAARSEQNAKQGEREHRVIVQAPGGGSPGIRRSEKVPTLDHEEIRSTEVSRNAAIPKSGPNLSAAGAPSVGFSGKTPAEALGQGERSDSEKTKAVSRSDRSPQELPSAGVKPPSGGHISPNLSRPVQDTGVSPAARSGSSEPVQSNQKPTQAPPPAH